MFLQDGLCDRNWFNNEQIVQSYYKFVVVRNPWDKFVSAWKYLDVYRSQDINQVLENLPSELDNGHDYRHITRQQSDLIFDENNIPVVDRIIRFESLNEDLKIMLEELGIKDITLTNSLINKGIYRDNSSYIDYFANQKTKAMFADKYSRDIKCHIP